MLVVWQTSHQLSENMNYCEYSWIISFLTFFSTVSPEILSVHYVASFYAVWGDIFGRQHGDAQKLGSYSAWSLLLPPSYIGQFRVWSRFEISLVWEQGRPHALSADCQLYRPECFQGYSQPTPTQLLPRWVRSLDLVPAGYQMKPFGHHFWPVQICFSNALLIKVNNFKTLLSTDLCLGAFFRSLWTAKPGARVFSCLDAAVFPLDVRIPQALERCQTHVDW